LLESFTNFPGVILRHLQHLWVSGKHASRVDHHSLLILCVKHLNIGKSQRKSRSIQHYTNTDTYTFIASKLRGWGGCSGRPDLVGVLAVGVVFIGQCQLRVQTAAKQQLEQNLLAGGHVLTDAGRLLQLGHVVTQLELHILLQAKQNHRETTG